MTQLHSDTANRHAATERPGARLNVLLAGDFAAMDAPGGGEIQMAALARTLPSWEDRFDGAAGSEGRCVDCLHLLGSLPQHVPVVEAARRHGVAVVLSTIAWFDPANCLREPRSWPWRLAAGARFAARAACPWLPSWRRRLYRSVDLLLPNSNAEAEQLVRYFRVPRRQIHVVPNGADERFAAADPEPFACLVRTRGFVLCAGRIEPRKNQLGLIQAMRDTNVPIVILGDAVPGHEAYMRACRRAAGENARFVPRIDHDDPLLGSAYAACGCLVLPGWFETPGLAALEAGMSGTPLVLPRGGCAREYFGPHAAYVRPGDLRGIRRAVLDAVARGRSETLAELVRTSFTWKTAAEVTRAAYERVA